MDAGEVEPEEVSDDAVFENKNENRDDMPMAISSFRKRRRMARWGHRALPRQVEITFGSHCK